MLWGKHPSSPPPSSLPPFLPQPTTACLSCASSGTKRAIALIFTIFSGSYALIMHINCFRFEGAMRRQLTLYVQRQVATASKWTQCLLLVFALQSDYPCASVAVSVCQCLTDCETIGCLCLVFWLCL